MTREHIAKILPVLQAYAEGRTIQMKISTGEWQDMQDISDCLADLTCYRIKPKPREFWVVDADDKLSVYKTDTHHEWISKVTPFEVIHVREVLE